MASGRRPRVAAGVIIEFYEGQDATGTLLGTDFTPQPLLPGGSLKLTTLVPAPAIGQTADFYVEVDEASKGDGAVLECNEDNNSDLTTAAACPAPRLTQARKRSKSSETLGLVR